MSGTEGPGTKRSGTERAGVERSGVERSGVERSGTERSGTERAGVERSGAAAALRPPPERSAAFQGLTAGAALGRLDLQRCAACHTVQYPPREACWRCLSTQLDWTPQSGAGELIAQTTAFHSHEPFFRARLPWRVGLIRLECGPVALAHVHAAVAAVPARVRVIARLDTSGQAVLIAVPEGALARPEDDEKLRQLLLPPAREES